MSEDYIELSKKIDELVTAIHSLDKNMEKNNLILDLHHKRSILLEKRQEYFRLELEKITLSILERITPLERHVLFVNIILKIAISLGGIAAFVLTAIKIIQALN